MDKPIRVHLSRKRGWRMPPNTVKVDRTTRWGNPWRVGDDGVAEPAAAVAHFRARLIGEKAKFYCERTSHMGRIRANIGELRGKNLACWCRLGAPCHADVLLDLANRPPEGQRP